MFGIRILSIAPSSRSKVAKFEGQPSDACRDAIGSTPQPESTCADLACAADEDMDVQRCETRERREWLQAFFVTLLNPSEFVLLCGEALEECGWVAELSTPRVAALLNATASRSLVATTLAQPFGHLRGESGGG